MEAVGCGEGVDTFHVQEPMKMTIVIRLSGYLPASEDNRIHLITCMPEIPAFT